MVFSLWAGGAAVAEQRLLTLGGALDRVISSDQTIAIADREVRLAQVAETRTLSRLLPSLSMGADANWRGNRTKEVIEFQEPAPVPAAAEGLAGPSLSLPRTVRQTRWRKSRSDQQSLGIDFSQPILDLTVGPARRQAGLARHMTEWQLRQRMREVLFLVTDRYFEVLKQQALLAEGKNTLGLTAQQVEQAEARLRAEEVIEADLLQAKVDHERARRDVLQSENALQLARARLAITLNYEPSASFRLVEPPAGDLVAEALERAIALAHTWREEVRVARLSVARTEAERAEIIARHAPTVNFQFGRDLATGSQFERSIGWTAGIGLNWAIFDRGQRVFDLRANQIQHTQDELRVQETFRTVSQDVIDAWYAIDLLRKTLASLQIEREAAEANFQVQREKYASGLATSIEVQTALRDLARARAQRVSAAFDLETAYRDLENATATYEAERIESAMRLLLNPQPPAPALPPATPAARP